MSDDVEIRLEWRDVCSPDEIHVDVVKTAANNNAFVLQNFLQYRHAHGDKPRYIEILSPDRFAGNIMLTKSTRKYE